MGCQSGTVLHLPYAFRADEERLTTVNSMDTVNSNAAVKGPAESPSTMQPNAEYDPGKMLQVIQHHPAMCVAAAHWAEELAAMNPERHRAALGNVLIKVAQKGQSWSS